MTQTARVPLSVKLLYTAFVAVLIPVYWHYYGPTNFLYFCDITLILLTVAIWTESPLLVSMGCVGVLVPQMFWLFDFAVNLSGHSLTGMTDYMFDSTHSLFLRLLSLFHGWLPFFLVYLVWAFGYDRRALPAWSALFALDMLICFYLMPPPTPHPGLTPVNINYVFGLRDTAAQTILPPNIWFLGLLLGIPVFVFAPTHFLLAAVMPSATQRISPTEAR